MRSVKSVAILLATLGAGWLNAQAVGPLTKEYIHAGSRLVAVEHPPRVVLRASYVPPSRVPRTTFDSSSPDPSPFSFLYDETLGNFEQKPGGPCHSGQSNPTYVKVSVQAPPMQSCTFQASYDSAPIPCGPGHIAFLNSGQEFVLNTDTLAISPATCAAAQPPRPILAHGQAGWFKLDMVIGGQSYSRKLNFVKNAAPAVALEGSYVPSVGAPRTTFISGSPEPPGFDFFYDQAQGHFEQKPGGPCHTGQNNPTYLKIRLRSLPIQGCSFQASYDSAPIQCSPGAVAFLNSGQELILNTDTLAINPATCAAAQPPRPILAPNQTGWFRVDVQVDGRTYTRKLNFRKRTP